MRILLHCVLLALLTSGCGKPKLAPRDVPFLAAGEQAIVGSYTLHSSNITTQSVCTLDVLTNHTFVISNLPVAGSSRTISSLGGTWSLSVYHVFDAQRYSVEFAGATNAEIIKVRFPNADLPSTPTELSVWVQRQGQVVDYPFRKRENTAP